MTTSCFQYATMDPYFNLYDIFQKVSTRIQDTVLYRIRDCAKEMVALNVEGRDILEMKVSLHVNSNILEDYPFEKSAHNYNDQQSVDLPYQLEDDDLLEKLEEDDLLQESEEDRLEQYLRNYNDQQSMDLPDQLEDDDLLEELEEDDLLQESEEDRFERYLRNYHDQQNVDFLDQMEDDDFLQELEEYHFGLQNMDLATELEDDDLLEELEEDHFEQYPCNDNDQQNDDLLEELEDDSISSDSIDQCSICLNKFCSGLEKELFHTKCSHVFHEECISKWIDRCIDRSSSYSCPLCRRR
ncbi:putative transcription factor C2H2 family [Medicago truncatula]|uniref:RING-type E3 ubiquitin transferase n=1 Tax=Medicago truncatula TaxID=3880 RepID=G7LHX6_MEDTR|nr:RING-H2 zinc finger protein [Medicago truncatula]RHN42582.1 putative transcription factor C2H2 family [Medicago truncatula]